MIRIRVLSESLDGAGEPWPPRLRCLTHRQSSEAVKRARKSTDWYQVAAKIANEPANSAGKMITLVVTGIYIQ